MIESLIGRLGKRLRELFRGMSLVGIVTIIFVGYSMGLATEAALASGPPEAPITIEPATSITGISAVLEGTLNPGASATDGWYFAYSNPGGTSCDEGPTTTLEPEVTGKALPEQTTVTGLQPSSKYFFCMVAQNGAGETTQSLNEVEFETAAEAPVVESEFVSFLTPFEARIEGNVNANNQTTECFVEYGKTSVSEKEVPCEQATVAGFGGQGIDVMLTGLEAATKYHYLIRLENASHEEGLGTEEEFETATAEAPTISSESVSSVTVSGARLAAVVNPDYQLTTCHFQYGETSVSEHELPCEPETFEGETEASVELSGLKSATKYHYRVVVENATGEREGTEEEFETVDPPSEVETGSAESIMTTTADVGGALNAGGEATYYIEYGTSSCAATTCGQKSAESSPVNGRTQEPVSPIELTGLKMGTTYHYWLVANNGATPEPVHGEAKEFTTLIESPSQIETGIAQSVTTTSAIVGGQLNPGGEARYYIAYGPGPCGTCEKSAEVVVRGETLQSITPIALSGLEPNTTYHYSLEVKNGVSEPLNGGEGVFTTAKSTTQIEEEEVINRKPQEELEAGNAAKSKLEAENKHREEAIAAAAAAQSKQYNEIAAVAARSKLQQEELERVEAIIAGTSVTITKTKLTHGGVAVTVKVTEPGTVSITGAGLRKKTAKLAKGTHTLNVALTSAGKKDRAHHKKSTLTATLDTSLTSVSAAKTLTL